MALLHLKRVELLSMPGGFSGIIKQMPYKKFKNCTFGDHVKHKRDLKIGQRLREWVRFSNFQTSDEGRSWNEMRDDVIMWSLQTSNPNRNPNVQVTDEMAVLQEWMRSGTRVKQPKSERGLNYALCFNSWPSPCFTTRPCSLVWVFLVYLIYLFPTRRHFIVRQLWFLQRRICVQFQESRSVFYFCGHGTSYVTSLSITGRNNNVQEIHHGRKYFFPSVKLL